MKHNNCNQLGVLCQSRTPPCRGVSCQRQHYFAPGVIEGMATRQQGLVTRIGFCVLVLSGLGAVCAVAGFALGYIPLQVL